MSDNNPYAAPRAEPVDERPSEETRGVGRVRGWLAFFCLALIWIAPIAFVARIGLEFAKVAELPDTPGLTATVLMETLLGGVATVFGIMAGLRLRAIRRDAVPFAKKFLATNAALTIASGFLPFVLMPEMTDAAQKAVSAVATQNGSRVLAFTAIWFLYLTYSSQVRELYPR